MMSMVGPAVALCDVRDSVEAILRLLLRQVRGRRSLPVATYEGYDSKTWLTRRKEAAGSSS